LREISSPQHPTIKYFVKLRNNRDFRYETRRLVVSGLKLIKELSASFSFRTLLVEDSFSPSFPYRAESCFSVSSSLLKKITGLENPEPIAAEIDMPKEQDVSSVDFLLILDGISDPGNLGTLLRTALALGWDGVFLTEGSTDPFNEKALRAAKGATFKLPLQTGSTETLLSLLKKKKRTLLAADVQGKDLSIAKYDLPLGLVLGNEAHGISAPLKKIGEKISIPMSGPMESLNVATAGGILMYTLKGQKNV